MWSSRSFSRSCVGRRTCFFSVSVGSFSLLLGWDPASGSEGLSEGVCLVILRVGGVSLGVVLGSGLVFGARPEHSLDSVQCLGLDSYLGFVCRPSTYNLL